MQVKQSSYRWGQNSIAVVTCSSQRAHFSLVNLSTSSKFGGVPRWTLVFSSSHRFSIAFKSGLCADQSVTLTLVLHQECLFTYILGHCHVGRSRPSFSAYCFRLYTSSFFSPNISSIFVAREFQFSFIRSDELAVCIQVVEWSSWFSLWVYTGSVQGCGDCPVLYNSYLAESFTRVLAVALGSLVTSLATFLSSLWSLVSYLCEGCSVLCDCLWISWYYFSFQFLTLWNTLKHSNHFVCSSSALWPSTKSKLIAFVFGMMLSQL